MDAANASDGNLNQRIADLLREVQNLPDMLFVMGKGPHAVMEGWLNPERTQVTVRGDWLGVESETWHSHLQLSEVKETRFVEQPDVHDPKRQSFSIRFLGSAGEPLLMIFFGGMYDAAGSLLQERVARFRNLHARFAP